MADETNPLIVRSLVIGIGGTGQSIVNSIKKQINRIYGDLPIVQYLVFDTDKKKDDASLIKESEFIPLTVDFADNYIKAIDKYPELKEWWPEELKRIGDVKEGAREIRAIGRFAFFRNIDKVRNTIQAKIEYIRQPRWMTELENKGFSVKKDLKVFIVSSLGGGTGSGIFLDMACNVRDILKNCTLSGYAILPDIFTVDETNRARIGANTYAALLELDHYMNPANSFSCEYGKCQKINNDIKPFDYYHIIGSESVDHHTNIKDTDAIEMIAKSIFLNLTSTVGLAADSSKNNIDFTLNTFVDPKNKKYVRAYGTIGLYSMYYPAPEIKELCSYKYSENLIEEILRPWDGVDEMVDSANRTLKGKISFEIDDLKKLLYDKQFEKPADIDGTNIEEIDEKDLVDKLKAWFAEGKDQVEKEIILDIQKSRKETLKEIESLLSKEIKTLVEDASKGLNVGYGLIERESSFVKAHVEILEGEKKRQKLKMDLEKELKKLEENIDKTIQDLDKTISSRFVLFKGDTIRRFKRAYLEFCVDYLNKYTDLQRERELKLLYTELLNVLSNLKGNLDEIERKLIQIKKDFSNEKEKLIHQLEIGGNFQLEKWIGTSEETINAMYNRHVISIGNGKQHICQNVLYDWKDYESSKISDTILSYSRKQYENISMNIDDVISNMSADIKNVLSNSRVHMTFSGEAIQEKFIPQDIEVINILGVPEKLTNEVKKIVDHVLSDSSKVRVISTKDNIRISNVIYNYGIPLIGMGPIIKLKSYYDMAKESKERPLHIMKINLENIT